MLNLSVRNSSMPARAEAREFGPGSKWGMAAPCEEWVVVFVDQSKPRGPSAESHVGWHDTILSNADREALARAGFGPPRR